jgi:hypothetical protein
MKEQSGAVNWILKSSLPHCRGNEKHLDFNAINLKHLVHYNPRYPLPCSTIIQDSPLRVLALDPPSHVPRHPALLLNPKA